MWELRLVSFQGELKPRKYVNLSYARRALIWHCYIKVYEALEKKGVYDWARKI